MTVWVLRCRRQLSGPRLGMRLPLVRIHWTRVYLCISPTPTWIQIAEMPPFKAVVPGCTAVS